MAGRLDNLQVNPVLTEVARGYKQQRFIGNMILPEVAVSAEVLTVPTFSKENVKLGTGVRGLRGPSNVLQVGELSTASVQLKEFENGYPVDYREGNAAAFSLQSWASTVAMDTTLLQIEKVIADLLNDTGSYAAGNQDIPSIKWDDLGNSSLDVVADIDDAANAFRAINGVFPDTMTTSMEVWQKLRRSPKIIELFKYSQSGVITPDMMKTIFPYIKNIYIGETMYSNDLETTFTALWSDNVILSSSVPAPDMYCPAFGYTYTLQGWPLVDTYIKEGGKVEVYRATKICLPKILADTRAYLINDVLS